MIASARRLPWIHSHLAIHASYEGKPSGKKRSTTHKWRGAARPLLRDWRGATIERRSHGTKHHAEGNIRDAGRLSGSTPMDSKFPDRGKWSLRRFNNNDKSKGYSIFKIHFKPTQLDSPRWPDRLVSIDVFGPSFIMRTSSPECRLEGSGENVSMKQPSMNIYIRVMILGPTSHARKPLRRSVTNGSANRNDRESFKKLCHIVDGGIK